MRKGIKLAGLLAVLFLLVACQQEQKYALEDIPAQGDVLRGGNLFRAELADGVPTCRSCHAITDERLNGPGMAGYGERAGNTVNGQDAREYSFLSIVNPSAHVVRGYSNSMYAEYQEHLSEQDIADLIAYMLSL
ncbi:MAG: c-type cytochrome [Anaerolineae bacterium]|nr:c-type cytochrome [Anaerolineae bacterium]